jgi:uncharacterized spore protein YtfJ
MSIHELLQTLGDRFATTASVKQIYGEPVTVGSRTVIPVARIRYGFGGGAGRKREDEEGGGGGGGVVAVPAGALEITPEGTRFIPFDDKRTIGAALAVGFVLGALIVSLTTSKRG